MDVHGQLQLGVDFGAPKSHEKRRRKGRINPTSPGAFMYEPVFDGLCRGGCGKPMPPGQSCTACATREAVRWAQARKQKNPERERDGHEDAVNLRDEGDG